MGSFLKRFQYMIILFLVFVLQFSVSCACLALNAEQQVGLHLSSLVSHSAGFNRASRRRPFPSPESPAGGWVEQVGGHAAGRGEDPQLLRLLQL